MSNYKNIAYAVLFVAALVAGNLAYSSLNNTDEEGSGTPAVNNADVPNLPSNLASTFPEVDFSQTLVDYEKVLWGGVQKDGIPALTNPKFDDLTAVLDRDGETLGVLLEIDGEKRYYPFNILVSHEIVNDSIGDTNFAVTFCPLCGSAIVFNANVNGETKEFGVSGYLFESNLIMYDRTETPSLWSQARGEAIIGDQTGTQLELIDFQLLTLDQVRVSHADAQILSEDTGTGNPYTRNPYGDYDQSESTLFPISVDDTRHFAKEIFYIVPQGEQSVAVKIADLSNDQTANNSELGLSINKNATGEINVTNETGNVIPGYFEMWFSWAQHHQTNGIVWTLD